MNDSSTQQVEEGQCTKSTSKKDENWCGNSKGVMIVYKECLKNHAASIGAHSTDGCGEYMPSSGEDALLCSACGCHRNFHRKEVDMGGGHTYLPECHYWCNACNDPTNQVLECHQKEGDDMKAGCGPHVTLGVNVGPIPTPLEGVRKDVKVEEVIKTNKKKRHRTRFSNEQKEKMLAFVEKIDWRLQKGNEGLVQQFCKEIGIKKRVLKVWMHNNKHLILVKKNSDSINNDHHDASDSSNHKQKIAINSPS